MFDIVIGLLYFQRRQIRKIGIDPVFSIIRNLSIEKRVLSSRSARLPNDIRSLSLRKRLAQERQQAGIKVGATKVCEIYSRH
jgi:hypothetical protein